MQLFPKSIALVISILYSTGAIAEDTAALGRILVEGDAPGSGWMVQEETPKARSSITRTSTKNSSKEVRRSTKTPQIQRFAGFFFSGGVH